MLKLSELMNEWKKSKWQKPKYKEFLSDKDADDEKFINVWILRYKEEKSMGMKRKKKLKNKIKGVKGKKS